MMAAMPGKIAEDLIIDSPNAETDGYQVMILERLKQSEQKPAPLQPLSHFNGILNQKKLKLNLETKRLSRKAFH